MRKSNGSTPARKGRQSHRKGTGRTTTATTISGGERRKTKPQQSPPAGRVTQIPAYKTMDSKSLDTALYIVAMTQELRNMAGDSGLDFLAYLLDMAAEEADGVIRHESQAASADTRRGMA
ncbi:hypothetical protein MNBD_ALPHA09-1130 [hydrothermal vent metagenome]|uniref:Uncharacterized protein n=1 Tax=hydrothermal vent metagenome TaxID=652676 RepID=A0A3B0UAV0_9ZZZZ